MTPAKRMRLYQLASQGTADRRLQSFAWPGGARSRQVSSLTRRRSTPGSADLLGVSVGSYDAPLLVGMCVAWAAGDRPGIASLNEEFLATRETSELRAATVQMGYSLRQLLAQLPDTPATILAALAGIVEPAFPCVWAAATTALGVDAEESLLAYLWSWAENQALVAVKTVPLGQSAGQRVLARIAPQLAERARATLAGRVPRSNYAPALAILSARHETQYSRLFRS